MTYTKAHADQNKALRQRAVELLKDADINSVAKDHSAVFDTMQAEFPAVSDVRIYSRMAQALRQMRYNQ